MTNFDKIKQMNVEQVAELLRDTECSRICTFADNDGKCMNGNASCQEGIKLWLLQDC